ncbi:MAG: M55 family metallopeptidase [Lentisphaerae bacterium]|nr:M55 family metallopeptidase [Lentisphaerota bacterium]
MKVFIITDLEGPAMVSTFAQTIDHEDQPHIKGEAMLMLTGEVNAAVDGILEAEPNADVMVWDAHGAGGIIAEKFHKKAKLIPRGTPNAIGKLDRSYNALFFVGQHAMAGTPKANLCHTYMSKKIEYYKLNGRLVGEFGARAFLAGTLGVPTIFISGDDKAIAEAKDLVPGIHCAIVKWGTGLESARHLTHEQACDLTRKTAREAILGKDNISPLVINPPYTLEIRVREGIGIDNYIEQGAKKLDDRTVILRADNIQNLPI